MNIRIALPEEYLSVRAFYHTLIDEMRGSPFLPGWEKELHPSDDMLMRALSEGNLFVCTLDGAVIGAMILNHESGQGYEEASWPSRATEEQATVLHVIAVGTKHQGSGVSSALLSYAIEYARACGQKALRLDVMAGNTPAERLYDKFGFRCVHTRASVYGTAGLITAKLLELPLC